MISEAPPSALRPLASPQPHGLAVLLKLGDELIALADHVLVLLVLVVGAVRLNHTLACDTVDGAGDAAGGDEAGEITRGQSQYVSSHFYWGYGVLPVEEVDGHAKVIGHALKANDAVALEQLLVGAQAHLTDEPALVLVEVAVLV